MAIEIRDLGLVINKNVLVLADFHIGLEEALNKEGVLVPRNQFRDIVERLKKILGKTKFRKIIINGDLKHEFGTISKQEWSQTLLLIDMLSRHAEKIILIKGNHDTILGPIAEKRKVEVADEIMVGKILICHGHKLTKSKNFQKAETIIIGHEHPSISIREGARAEKFKCFLFGSYKGKDLIVMPSFNPLVEGADVTREKVLSPYIKNVGDFRAVVVSDDGKTYDFGKIRDIKNV